MASATLSQDFLSICLLLAEGDLEINLQELIRRVELFQETKNRHFGITRNDFRGLIRILLLENLGVKNFLYEIKKKKLKDIISVILKYDEVYCNDEVEQWGFIKNHKPGYLKKYFDLSEEDFLSKVLIKRQMKKFLNFEFVSHIPPKLICKFMDKLEISEKLLFNCSRPGRISPIEPGIK